MNNDLERFSEERLMRLSEAKGFPPLGDVRALAHIALAAKQAKPIGEIRLSEYLSDGTREASVVCLHDQADWDNFTDGTKLYLNKNPVTQTNSPAIPDGWKLVPVEPTPATMVEGTLVSEFQADPAGMYRAMIAAAPKPESE